MLRKDFNRNWTFVKDDSTLMEAGEAIPVKINLPHDAMIKEARDAKNPSGNAGAFYAGGNYLYEKLFPVPAQEEGKQIFLEFEGVYRNARVYVNGAFAGACVDGYRKFLVDISPYLNYGEENKIAVKVCNGDVPNSRWYTGSGIYRPVNLLIGDQIHMAADGLKIRTPEVAEDISCVETELNYESISQKTKKVYFQTTILDEQGNYVAEENTPVTIFPGKTQKIYQRIYIRNAKLWSVDHPNLYRCVVKIMDADGCVNMEACRAANIVLDETNSTFGIRHIQIDPMYGLRINGEQMQLRGACIHHDNGVVGAATFARAEERRVEFLKKAGFNAIRMAHNSSSVQLLDACDRIGMLVMEESFDMWTNSKNPYDDALLFENEWKKNLEALVAKDYNHPCVMMYSIGNEIQEIGTPSGAETNRRLANKIRELDSTRLVTNAINGLMTVMGNNEELIRILLELGLLTVEQVQQMADPSSMEENGDINDVMTMLMGTMNTLATHHLISERLEESIFGLDLVGYNYMSGRYVPDGKSYPNRIMYGSETLPPDIDVNWQYVKENPQVLGDFTWTGWDYIGEAGVGVVDYNTTTGFFKPFPVYLAYCGDIDILGNRRPMSYYREIVWGLREDPYIAVEFPEHYQDRPFCTPWTQNDSLSSWTWPAYEGKPIKVEVYSNSDEVELFLNGESLGRALTGEKNRYKALFDLQYQPGILEAVGYTKGQVVGRFSLKTAGEEKHLAITCDCEKITEGEIAYLNIALEDQEGILNTAVDTKVSVVVEGCGELEGFGSADPASMENFYDKERTTFYGKALAVIRAKEGSGTIDVTVSAEGYESKNLKIMVCN